MLPKAIKHELDRFGRLITLLLNRSMMYEINHPYVGRALDEFYPLLNRVLRSIHPVVFAMNRDQFFVDDEPLDPQVNTKRILAHFKKTGMESISFFPEVSKKDIQRSLEVFFSLNTYPDAAAMKEALIEKGILNLKINHVVFRKVTEDDEVVPREEISDLSPEKQEQARERSKRLLMDMVMENMLGEELGGAIDLKKLVENPRALSKGLVEADIRGSSNGDPQEREPGPLLLRQLQVVGDGVRKGLSGGRRRRLQILR